MVIAVRENDQSRRQRVSVEIKADVRSEMAKRRIVRRRDTRRFRRPVQSDRATACRHPYLIRSLAARLRGSSGAAEADSPRRSEAKVIGGEGGIRTLDTLLTYTHFPGVLLQPLGHLSGKPAKGKTDLDSRQIEARKFAVDGRQAHGNPRRGSPYAVRRLSSFPITGRLASAAAPPPPRQGGHSRRH